MKYIVIVGALLLSSTSAFAQAPYAGMQSRPIKALSEQQLADLQAGRGMGLALAAELNGSRDRPTSSNWQTNWSSPQISSRASKHSSIP